ncbi:DUF6354 family protein [Streptomyces sp. NPDC004549]|uniref:DUF6354 family protein n=1 Tax=Streptomyces sp. NPDC004549 TaxID=3154283 RepID=UPI0033B1968D
MPRSLRSTRRGCGGCRSEGQDLPREQSPDPVQPTRTSPGTRRLLCASRPRETYPADTRRYGYVASTRSQERQHMNRTVRVGQLYRDLARDMRDRDRRLRVLSIGDDDRAECSIEHDLGGPTGKTPRIQVRALATPAKFELLEEASHSNTDPRFVALLAAVTAIHGPAATPLDYALAAWDSLGLEDTANHEAP